MQIKRGVLACVVFCLGTALAMAVSGYDGIATSEIVHAEKVHSSSNQLNAGQHDQAQSDIRFDLSTVKRTIPNKIRSNNLFQPKSWYVPPTPQPTTPIANLLPPQPTVPSLPFTYIGRMIDGNEATIFLSKNDRQYTVKVNDLLDDTYRVDEITDNSVVLTYLPVNTQQTLVFSPTAVGSMALSAMASPQSKNIPAQ